MDSINPHKSQQEQARCLPAITQNIMNRRKKKIILGFTIIQDKEYYCKNIVQICCITRLFSIKIVKIK